MEVSMSHVQVRLNEVTFHLARLGFYNQSHQQNVYQFTKMFGSEGAQL